MFQLTLFLPSLAAHTAAAKGALRLSRGFQSAVPTQPLEDKEGHRSVVSKGG